MIDRLLIFAAILAIAAGAWYSFEGVLKENGELRTERASMKETLAEQSSAYLRLALEKEAADKVAAAARQRAAKAQGEFDAYRNSVSGILSSDPEARAWADSVVPARVADCLRAGADCNDSGSVPGVGPVGVARADVRARVTAPPDKPGTSGSVPGVSNRSQDVQRR